MHEGRLASEKREAQPLREDLERHGLIPRDQADGIECHGLKKGYTTSTQNISETLDDIQFVNFPYT